MIGAIGAKEVEHLPKKVWKRKSKPAPASWLDRELVDSRIGMTMKQAAMPLAVHMNALRRPKPSIRKTERREQRAYSVPPQAAMRWDMPGLKSKLVERIWLAYVETL